MSNINVVALSGNLTRDPELRHTAGGTSVANIGIAVTRSRKQDDGSFTDDVSFFDLTVFGKRGETVSRKLSKGDLVSLEGRLEQRSWEDKESGAKRSAVSVIVNTINGEAFFKQGDVRAATSASDAPAAAVADDDIPF